jgi:hypothetical protein
MVLICPNYTRTEEGFAVRAEGQGSQGFGDDSQIGDEAFVLGVAGVVGERAVEETAGRAHEPSPGQVFLVTGLLAHEHQAVSYDGTP